MKLIEFTRTISLTNAQDNPGVSEAIRQEEQIDTAFDGEPLGPSSMSCGLVVETAY